MNNPLPHPLFSMIRYLSTNPRFPPFINNPSSIFHVRGVSEIFPKIHNNNERVFCDLFRDPDPIYLLFVFVQTYQVQQQYHTSFGINSQVRTRSFCSALYFVPKMRVL